MNEAEQIAELRSRVAELERELQAVQHIATQLSRQTEVDSIVRRALEVAMEALAAEAGSVLLYDPNQDKLVFAYVVGGGGEALIGVPVDIERSIAGRVFREGRTYVSEDVQRNAHHDTEIEARVQYVTTNMVTCPLIASTGEVIGVLQVLNKRGMGFGQDDVAMLEVLAHQIATRIETARLQQAARVAEIVKYVGNISHDVKNMLTPVQTGVYTLEETLAADAQVLQELLEREDLPADAKEPLGNVVDDLQTLAPEILQMMLAGALDAQQRAAEISNAVKGMVSQPEFKLVGVRETIGRVIAALNLQAESRGVTLALEAPADMPAAEVDERHLYNAAYNLVFNAIEAVGEKGGGQVRVRLAAQAEGVFPEGNYLELEVADNGPGIPEEIRSKLFTEQAVSTKPMGTGLGTRIVKNAVDVHGGTIQVESELGVGTTIRVRVPLRRNGGR
jgi:signal transduction histidine kinase